MFKMLFNDSTSDEVDFNLIDNSTLGNMSDTSSSHAAHVLAGGINICEYDPLDMSEPLDLPTDDFTGPAAGNTNVCDYDPLNYSDPNEMPIDEDNRDGQA